MLLRTLLAPLALVLLVADARAQATTVPVSVSSAGVPANGGSAHPAISDDGQFVAFESEATNLVPNDTNGERDVFLRDVQAGTTIRVSEGAGGVQGDGPSAGPFMSANGRVVVFTTVARNLLSTSLPPIESVVLSYDRETGLLTLLSGLTVDPSCSFGADRCTGISSDARFVAIRRTCYGSSLFSLLDRSTGIRSDIYSVNTGGLGGPTPVSDDGRFIAYPVYEAGFNYHLRDRAGDRTWRMMPGFNGNVQDVTMSRDGRRLAYWTTADVLQWDQNARPDVYLFDRQLQSLGIVSTTPSGGSHTGNQYPIISSFAGIPVLSADGSQVLFATNSTYLAAPLYPGQLPTGFDQQDGFVLKNLSTGAIELVSIGPDGAPVGGVDGVPALSRDGRHVVFVTSSVNPGPPNVLYLRDRWFSGPAAYCEPKPNSRGCLPAIGFAGSSSLGGTDDFHITASRVIPQSPGIMFWGSAPDFTPFRGGTRCVRSPIVRTAVQVSSGTPGSCSGTYDYHFTHAYMGSHLLGAGATLYAQFWQRDGAHVDGTGSGLTDALVFTITP